MSQGYHELYAKHNGQLQETLDFRVKRGFCASPQQIMEKGIMTWNAQQPLVSRNQKTRGLDYREHYRWMNEQLTARIESLAVALLGNPAYKRPTEWRWGQKGELVVYMSGKRAGWFADFESGASGDALELVKYKTGYQGKGLSDWVRSFIGYPSREVRNTGENKWTPVIPVPNEAGEPDIAGNQYLNVMLKEGAKETRRHAYRDEEGKLIGYVIRIEKANGSKITPPLAYCENENGFRAWKWQGFETGNRTPYGIEKLAQDPDKPVLVVEGEKTADDAQKLLPEYHVLTWGGGKNSVGKTNWQCLVGKEVAIWPDYDQGGQIAAEKLQQTLKKLNRESGAEGRVGIVDLPPLETGSPSLLPDNWDLADALPEGWTLDTVRQMIKDAMTRLVGEETKGKSNPKEEGVW